MRSVDVAGDDGHIRACDEHSNLGFEAAHLPIARACAFREKRADALITNEPLFEVGETAPAERFAINRHGIKHRRGESGDGFVLEKHILRRNGKVLIAPLQGNHRRKQNRVEMARVIGDDHKRRFGREMMAAFDGQAVVGVKDGPRIKSPAQPRDAGGPAVLAMMAAVLLKAGELMIAGRRNVPIVHALAPGEESSNHARFFADGRVENEREIVQRRGRQKNKAIETI